MDINFMKIARWEKIFADLGITTKPDFTGGNLNFYKGMQYTLPDRDLSVLEKSVINAIDELNGIEPKFDLETVIKYKFCN